MLVINTNLGRLPGTKGRAESQPKMKKIRFNKPFENKSLEKITTVGNTVARAFWKKKTI